MRLRAMCGRSPVSLEVAPCAAALAVCLGLGQPAPSSAVTISPNTRFDVVADDGKCSLREAVIAANSDSPSGGSLGECPAGNGADVITLQARVYELTIAGAREDGSRTGDLDVRESLEIRGNTNAGGDPSPYVIDANGIDRAFGIVSSADTVKFVGFTIENGDATVDNAAGSGGGLYSEAGSLTLDRVLVRNNRGYDGGGIYLDGGDVTIRRSTIARNTATNDGGGVRHFQGGSLLLQRSVVRGNAAVGDNSDGGGLSLRSPYVIWTSSILFNSATDDGGGVESDVGSGDRSSIRRSLIAANEARTRRGGGLYLATGKLWLRNTTVSSNGAGRHGDQIFSWDELTLRNATIRDPTPASGRAVQNNGVMRPSNTVFVGRCHHGAGASVTSSGGNIESPENTCRLTAGSDRTGVSAAQLNLQPLDADGGPTLTHFPALPSVAIDTGRDATCESKDQRLFDRPLDGNGNGVSRCDVGAVEVRPCQLAASVTLSHETETGTKTYRACNTVTAGPDYVVGSSADVDLRAGKKIVLRDGFQVRSGGSLRLEVDPSIGR